MLGTDLGTPATSVTAEAIIAWRAWRLFTRRDVSELRLRPIAGSNKPWTPLEPARASCRRPRLHEAPAFACTCGLYGTHGSDILRRSKDPAVVGTVALWGHVIEHEHGYRAAFAYPQRLRLICYVCFWQWGLDGRTPEVVARLPRGRLIPLCREHVATSVRYGFPIRRVLPARDVQQGLLSTYAVDVLGV